LQRALSRVDRVLAKAKFWHRHSTKVLNERQIKVLNRLLDTAGDEFEQGINARKYQSLAKVSKATATRDLAELVHKGCLVVGAAPAILCPLDETTRNGHD